MRDYRHWGQIGAAFVIGGALLSLSWYGLVLSDTTRHLPLWPIIPLVGLIAIGVYFLLAGWGGFPVPLEKTERERIKTAMAAAVAERLRAEREAVLAAQQKIDREQRRLKRATHWQSSASVGMNRDPATDSREPTIVLTLSPHADYLSLGPGNDLNGTVAKCEVSRSANLFRSAEPVRQQNMPYLFVAFPQAFIPRTSLTPGEYFVRWYSDRLNECCMSSFRINGHGQFVLPVTE